MVAQLRAIDDSTANAPLYVALLGVVAEFILLPSFIFSFLSSLLPTLFLLSLHILSLFFRFD